MLCVVSGQPYKAAALEDLPLWAVARLRRELRELEDYTDLRTWGDVRRARDEIRLLPPGQRDQHPEAVFMSCLMVWAAQAAAGESIALLDAIDHPLSEIVWQREPGDPSPEAGEGEGKARRPSGSGAARPASRSRRPAATTT